MGFEHMMCIYEIERSVNPFFLSGMNLNILKPMVKTY